jgi:phage-related tail protein
LAHQQHQFTEITCPETGRTIVVKRMLDPIGQLYVTSQISEHQRAAAEAYQADVEASSLRAPSRGPDDLAGWRSRRQTGYSKHSNRLRRVAKDLTSDQAKAVKDAMAGHKVDIRQLGAALDALAFVYGLSTRTRH